MHIGLFFGSFNPVHVGHMVLANYMAVFAGLEEVWFVVSPQNPLKPKAGLLDQHQRLALVNLAIDDAPRLRASNIEFSLPRPSYTVNTLAHLTEKYPGHRFTLIMGADNLATFHKWKNYEEILQAHRILVYPRAGADPGYLAAHPQVTVTSAPLIEISATFIRQALREKKDVRFFLPHKVWKEVDEMNYYRNRPSD